MNKLSILLTLALPVSAVAQEGRAAIIIEEDSPVESAQAQDVIDTAVDTSVESIKVAKDVPTDILENLLSEPVEEQLPEQPSDIKAPTPAEPVLVKTEKPKQIQLSANDNSELELLSPWAPKPLQTAPKGWRYTPVTADRSYPLEVKLSSGKSVSLSVTPYALVPNSSLNVIQAREPGYQPERGYQQIHSVTARLQTTTQTLDTAAASLDESISNLSALVNSLPK